MPQIPYIFNQLTSFIPRDVFDRLVKRYGGNAYVKNYSCWNHLLVMVWAQLTSRRSLRDIETSLRAHSDKTYRMGIGREISRNNIAHANARRDVAIYRELAQEMMRRAASVASKDLVLKIIGDIFGLGGFLAVDSSSVSLDLDRYRWSVPQEGSGGLKLHTMYDLLRDVPRMCLVTGHEERDQTFMEDYPYERGCLYVFDRLYFKSRALFHIDSSGAYFVTRLKRNVVLEVEEQFPVDGRLVLSDQVIRFGSRWARSGYPGRIRRVRYYSPEKNEVLDFISNNFEIDAATIALLYRYRWRIETFFKWIKQHLRIRAFYGTSANAVMIQIYVAYVSFCLLALASDAIGYKSSLYEFSSLMSVSLTERAYLMDLAGRADSSPLAKAPDGGMRTLFDF